VEERLSWLRVSEEREAREGALMSVEECDGIDRATLCVSSVDELSPGHSCLQVDRSGSREEAFDDQSRPFSRRSLTSFSYLTKQQVLRAHLELNRSGRPSSPSAHRPRASSLPIKWQRIEDEPIAVHETE
jgi:hypothetical protein